ncbi:MAG: type 4a pilus biogenesis protein PilO [Acidobacteria bacterium]|nr:type 4a pilus biogenesis protein PilO [Acidobacteriota bacterium]
MAGFRDLPAIVNVLLAAALAVVIVGAGFYIPGSPIQTQAAELDQATAELNRLGPEIARLKDYERRHADLKQQIAGQQKQLEVLKTIVPEDKEVDEFLRMIHASAVGSSVEIRRVTAKPVNALEFHNELPFEVEFDGPYFAVWNFFGRLGRLSRIINVSDLSFLGPERASSSINRFSIRPQHTVIAICTVTTFYTKLEPGEAKADQGKQPGKQPAKR